MKNNKIDVKNLFKNNEFQRIIDLTPSSKDSLEQFYRVRSFIELNLIKEAELELNKTIPHKKPSVPLVCLVLNQMNALNLVGDGERFWLHYKSLILEYIQNQNKNKDLWIKLLINECLWSYERVIDTRFNVAEWLASKVQKLSNLSDSNKILEFINQVEDKVGPESDFLWKARGLFAQKNESYYEAAQHLIRHFKLSEKGYQEKVFLLRYLINRFGKNALLIEPEIAGDLMEETKPLDHETKDFWQYLELKESLIEYKGRHKKYKIDLVDENHKWGAPDVDASVLRAFTIVASEIINTPTPTNLNDFVVYALEPNGKAIYLSQPKERKIFLREASFSRISAYQQLSADFRRVDLRAARNITLPPQRHRYIVSPGRVGSTLIHKMLREAGIESISETNVDCIAPSLAWRGLLSKDDAIFLSKLDSHLLFNEGESRYFIVKKLSANSSRYVEALLSQYDDVVFLYREIEPWIESYQRLNAEPKHIAMLLENTLHSHAEMVERDKVVSVLSYNDLVEVNTKALESAFGDIPHKQWKKFNEDSQAGTNFSRSKLIIKTPKYSIKEYWDAIKKSPALDMARDLKLDLIASASPSSRAAAITYIKRQNNSGSALVIPAYKWGQITHYYHFMFGLFLPFLSREIDCYSDSYYYLPEVGPMGRHFSRLEKNGWSFRAQSEEILLDTQLRKIVAIGWDHPSCYEKADLERVRDYLFDIFSIKPKATAFCRKILMVGRGTIENKHDLNYVSGAQRRTIPNLQDLYLQLKEGANVQFVELDSMELDNQIELFANSDCIIAQHGAALSNLVFCRPQTTVVEIIDGQPRCPFFSGLSERMQLKHVTFGQEHCKAAISIPEIMRVLRSNNCI